MNNTRALSDAGQSIWLDNITRDLLTSGTLKRYISDLSVTGLTSNPSIFDKAIRDSESYDPAIHELIESGKSDEEVFYSLALNDITAAADLFAPVHLKTSGVDGWASLEVSPLLAHDAVKTVASAMDLYARANRRNVFIKIPGTKQGLTAIEEATFAGVPINVTLLFSKEQYVASANAYLNGIERRIAGGLNANVASVASVFISRWDSAVADAVPTALRNTLGIAVGQQCYAAYNEIIASDRCRRAMNAGGRPQRLLFASTGTKDPGASDVLYIEAFAAPFTINTIPVDTLKAFADHGRVGDTLPADGGNASDIIASHASAGIDIDALAAKLQNDGADSFVQSWKDLLAVIAAKRPQSDIGR